MLVLDSLFLLFRFRGRLVCENFSDASSQHRHIGLRLLGSHATLLNDMETRVYFEQKALGFCSA